MWETLISNIEASLVTAVLIEPNYQRLECVEKEFAAH
jgi:hypothetical protein